MLKAVGYYLRSIGKLLSGFHETTAILRIFLFPRAKNSRYLITLCKSGLRFCVRSAMDVWSIKETFLDNFYLPKGMFDIKNDGTVIDIGAGIGDFSLLAATLVPQGKVFAFEAFPESFQLLQENINLNGISNITACSEAVGAEEGYVFLEQSTKEPLQFSARGRVVSSAETIKSISLEGVFERYQLSFCHLLKLDCEGAEYEILFPLSQNILKRIGAVTMEYHDHITSYSHKDLADFLHQHGFEVKIQPNNVHSHLGYLFAKRRIYP